MVMPDDVKRLVAGFVRTNGDGFADCDTNDLRALVANVAKIPFSWGRGKALCTSTIEKRLQSEPNQAHSVMDSLRSLCCDIRNVRQADDAEMKKLVRDAERRVKEIQRAVATLKRLLAIPQSPITFKQTSLALESWKILLKSEKESKEFAQYRIAGYAWRGFPDALDRLFSRLQIKLSYEQELAFLTSALAQLQEDEPMSVEAVKKQIERMSKKNWGI